ncbi:MAG: ABC transporter ATP-binding protein [Eggerthellaceae bacterium]|nr:ABC transporter ATP-binding protein [Eggerthellaceae bacterium]
MLGLVRQIMKFCGPYARRIRVAWVFSFLRALCANVPLVVAVVLINMLMEGSLAPAGCVVAAVVMVALMVLQSLFQHAADRLQSTAGFELFADKRLELANHLRRLPMGYFSAGNMGKISSVLSADMVFIEEHSMMVLADIASNIFAQLVITVFMFALNVWVGLAVLAAEVVAVALAQPMNREAFGNSGARQQAVEDLTSALLEYIEGLRMIKSFNRAGEGAADLRAGFRRMTEANLGFEEEHAPWLRRLLIVYALGTTAVVALSVWLLESGGIAAGTFVGVMLFAFNLFAPLKALYQLDSQITIMQAALERLQSLFDEPEIADVAEGDRAGAGAGEPSLLSDGAKPRSGEPPAEVEFRNVTFAYLEKDVLQDVSFTAQRGQTVALVGQSGSGKSTIANLLARFWDVKEGAVLLRGVDIRTMPLAQLMDNLSMVFQHVYLFEDTVYRNIAMGRPDATEEEVCEAARRARCYDFIAAMPYGFNTRIGEGGATLSGGEAQRISIARAILKDAPVIILDEATASIDADNESAIQAAMSELCRSKTTLVIAHRLNTIAHADKIVVLEDGRVAEQGSSEELLEAGGVFAAMVASAQASHEWSSAKRSPSEGALRVGEGGGP